MVLPRQSHLAWKITISILHVLAYIWTGLRLRSRLKSRLWWDDAAIAVAVLFDIFYFIQFWIKYKGNPIVFTIPPTTNRLLWSPWYTGLLFTAATWFAKISAMVTLARVFAHFIYLRMFAIGLAGCFFTFFVANSISSALGCERVEGAPWYMVDIRKCITVGNGIAVNTLMGTIFVFFANATFFAFPFLLLKKGWGQHQSRLLGIITFLQAFLNLALAAFFHAFQQAGKNHPDAILIFVATSHLTAPVNIMVTNLSLDLLSLNGFFHKSSGLTTFTCTGNDAVAMTSRNARMARSMEGGRGSASTSSLGELTLTPISTDMQSDYCPSNGQRMGSSGELGSTDFGR